MLKERVGADGGTLNPVYKLKLNGEVLCFSYYVIFASTLYERLGIFNDDNTLYKKSGDHLWNVPLYEVIWLKTPPVGDVFYGEFQIPEFYSRSYLEEKQGRVGSSYVEVKEIGFTAKDRELLGRWGICL